MQRNLFIAYLMIITYVAAAQSKTIGKIVSFSPEFDRLVSTQAKIEVLGEGFTWSEGPVWVKKGNYLLFSDVPNNTIYKWEEGRDITVFLKPSGYTGILPYSREPGSNGLTISNDGQLIACEHGDRRISIMPFEIGGKKTLSDNFEGKRFNSPNDVVQHSSGVVYFTDPPYGLPQQEKDTSREINFFGVFRIGTDGKTSVVVKDLNRPNGLAFSPDERILYVAQSDPKAPYIMAYDVEADGSLSNGRIFFDASSEAKKGLKGLPDGLKIDTEGRLFATGPGGVLVISPDGKLLGRIETGLATANCAWGGEDGSVLYMTATGYLCRVQTKTKGARW